METKNDKPKITTSVDAHNYLIQNIELKSLKKNDCFFAIYLNENNEVLSLKTIEKKKTELDLEIVGQILDFDKNLNVNSLIVFHNPVKNKGVLSEIPIANMLIDKSFFACIDVLDYQWLSNDKYYHSMFDHKNVNFGKYSSKKKETIRKNEQYTSNTNLQELFDMDVDKLKKMLELEHEKISSADSFIFWELIDSDYLKYSELRFNSVFPWKFELPLTKMYLVGIFKEYMKVKDRIMKFINESNLYDKYLFSIFDYSEYRKKRAEEKAAIEEKSKIPQGKRIFTMEKNQIFKPGQKVVCNRFSEINNTSVFPEGIKKGGIYVIDKIEQCECGISLLVLNGTSYVETKERVCRCGKGGFDPNAFIDRRFDIVHLNIAR